MMIHWRYIDEGTRLTQFDPITLVECPGKKKLDGRFNRSIHISQALFIKIVILVAGLPKPMVDRKLTTKLWGIVLKCQITTQVRQKKDLGLIPWSDGERSPWNFKIKFGILVIRQSNSNFLALITQSASECNARAFRRASRQNNDVCTVSSRFVMDEILAHNSSYL
jgi:hypothetical protein